jgi:spore germination protein KB
VKIDHTQVSGMKLLFMVACFIQASALLTSFLLPVIIQDSWIAVIGGTVLCLPLIWVYGSLMVNYPDRNFLQLLEECFGRVAGKILGVMFVWFFMTLASLNLIDMAQFVKLTTMEDTPCAVLAVMAVAVAAIAVRQGLKVVAWYSSLFFVISSLILVASLIMVTDQMSLENFLPTFELPAMEYVQGTHIIATIPFGEVIAFLMLTPNLKIPGKNAHKYLMGGFAAGAATLLLVVVRDIGVLGSAVHLFTLPSLITFRLISLGEALSRMEILFSIVLIILLFFKILLLFYVTTISIAQLFGLKAYWNLALATGALIITYGLTLYPYPVEHAASGQEVTPVMWTFFEIIMPVVVLIVAKLRKLPRTGRQEA